MVDVSKIYAALGRLEAQGEESQRQRGRLFRMVADIKADAAGHGPRLGALERAHKDDIKPVLDDYKRTKAKGLGLLFGLGLVAGGVGGNAGKAWAAVKEFLGL